MTKNGVPYKSATSLSTKQQVDFSFTPNDNATYTISLVVRDPATGDQSLAPAVSVDVRNVAPVAEINLQTGEPTVGLPVSFTSTVTEPGTNAFPDAPPHDDLVSYAWRVTTLDGSSVPGGSAATFSFTPPVEGLYIVQLTARDKDGDGFTRSEVVEAQRVGRTVLVGGPAGAVNEGTPVPLTAAVDHPPAGVTFAFAWQVLKNGDQFATGSGPAFTFTPDDNGHYDVHVTAVGSDRSSGSADVSFDALNVTPAPTVAARPPFAFLNGTLTAPEGTALTLVGAANDPGALDAPSLLWTVTGPGLAAPLTGTAPEFNFTLLNEGTYSVALRATDKDGAVATATRTVVGTNVAPTVTLSGGGTAGPGLVTIAARYSDSGPLDTPGVYRWFLNNVFQPGVTGPTFTFAPVPGDNVVRVEVSDPAGAVATTTTLVLAGSPGNDAIVVTTPGPAVDRVLVLGMGGNDMISAAAVSVPVILDGGDGDDTLIGGSGGDLLFAGPGNNSLVAGLGDDTLVGGGNDTLDGGAGNDNESGDRGSDRMFASFGTDTLNGGHGEDLVEGGKGDDSIIGGPNADTLDGGFGTDTLDSVDGHPNDSVDGGHGSGDTCTSDVGDTVVNCEF